VSKRVSVSSVVVSLISLWKAGFFASVVTFGSVFAEPVTSLMAALFGP